MVLKRLTLEDVPNILDKTIICYEKSHSSLYELQEIFSARLEISVIIDDFKRNQGQVELRGNCVKIVSSEYLETADLTNTVLIITSDYFKEAYEKLCSIPQVARTLDMIYFFANKETQIELAYREKYNKIFYLSDELYETYNLIEYIKLLLNSHDSVIRKGFRNSRNSV